MTTLTHYSTELPAPTALAELAATLHTYRLELACILLCIYAVWVTLFAIQANHDCKQFRRALAQSERRYVQYQQWSQVAPRPTKAITLQAPKFWSVAISVALSGIAAGALSVGVVAVILKAMQAF